MESIYLDLFVLFIAAIAVIIIGCHGTHIGK